VSPAPAQLAGTLPPDAIKIATDPITEPFWLAAKQCRLVALRCGDCGHFRMPPTPFCPQCQSQNRDYHELSGDGTVFSFAVVHGLPGLPDLLLVSAVVSLPDAADARLVTNVVGVDPEQVYIGMPLTVDFVDIADGWRLPVFRPA
jgi:uncharacterized OB-fold protein